MWPIELGAVGVLCLGTPRQADVPQARSFLLSAHLVRRCCRFHLSLHLRSRCSMDWIGGSVLGACEGPPSVVLRFPFVVSVWFFVGRRPGVHLVHWLCVGVAALVGSVPILDLGLCAAK